MELLGCGRKNSSLCCSFFFCYTKFPKRIWEQIHFWTKDGLLKWKPTGVREVVPLWVTTEWSHKRISSNSPLTEHTQHVSFEMWGRASNQTWSYTIPPFIQWQWLHISPAFWLWTLTNSGHSPPLCDKLVKILSPNSEKRAERSIVCGFYVETFQQRGNMRKFWFEICWMALYLLPDTKMMLQTKTCQISAV